MSGERKPRIIKARERLDAMPKSAVQEISSANLLTCDTLSDVDGKREAAQPTREQLREKFMELRRAYLSFERFVKVDCGIEI